MDTSGCDTLESNNKPIIVISQRRVKPGEMEGFGKDYQAAADAYNATQIGFKSLVCIVDAKDENLVHDIQWFNTDNAFMEHINMELEVPQKYMMPWLMHHDMSVPFTGDVFGGWD